MFLQRADRLALVDFKNRHINYTELINNIKYFSEYVINLEKDRFGLIIMENRPEWIYGFMAIWDKNSAGIALDANSNPQEILYVLNDANPDIILCSDETQKNISDAVNQYEFKDKIKIISLDNKNIDLKTLERIESPMDSSNYFKDKNGVYFLNGEKFVKINGADIDTFEVTMSGKYGKDKNNVYFEGKKMEGENPKKFEEMDIND